MHQEKTEKGQVMTGHRTALLAFACRELTKLSCSDEIHQGTRRAVLIDDRSTSSSPAMFFLKTTFPKAKSVGAT
jgi:hypothetical protein